MQIGSTQIDGVGQNLLQETHDRRIIDFAVIGVAGRIAG